MKQGNCTTCLSPGIKRALKEIVDPELYQMIDSVPNCSAGEVLQFCPVSEAGVVGKPQKRPRSAYQQFISDCMKTKPIKGKPFGAASQYMKECAREWRERKNAS
jgi:hypothetical protein